MGRVPGTEWRPLAGDWASQPRMAAHNIICIHTMVGTLDGTDGYFRSGNGVGYGGSEAHVGIGPTGRAYQWQDDAFQADANLDGNPEVLSIENADRGAPFPAWSGSDVPAFTEQQIEANAQICAYWCRTYAIPPSLIPDTLPGRRGIAVHRQGVPGMGLVPGGVQWSSSFGKVCPGDRRTQQVSTRIIPRVREILAQEDDDMFTDADRALLGAIHYMLVPSQGWFGPAGSVVDRLGALQYALIPEGGLDSRGEVVKRLRAIQTLLGSPRAVAAELRTQLAAAYPGQEIDQAMLERALRNVLDSVEAQPTEAPVHRAGRLVSMLRRSSAPAR